MGENTRTCCCECDHSEAALLARIGELAAEYRGKEGSLIQVLHMAQGIYGYLPIEVQRVIADTLEELADYFQTIAFGQPQFPVLFNCLGRARREDDPSIPELLVRQVQSSVWMEDSIRSMADQGVDAIVEIGPGKALSGFVRKTVPGLPVCAVESTADVEGLKNTLEQLMKEKDQ